jgi:uncharacterized protein YjiS (DUF1127 family)
MAPRSKKKAQAAKAGKRKLTGQYQKDSELQKDIAYGRDVLRGLERLNDAIGNLKDLGLTEQQIRDVLLKPDKALEAFTLRRERRASSNRKGE